MLIVVFQKYIKVADESPQNCSVMNQVCVKVHLNATAVFEAVSQILCFTP